MKFDQLFKKYNFLLNACNVAEELNVKAYIVGGSIRDFILNRQRNLPAGRQDEIDFLIIGDGPAFASALAERLGIKNVTIFKNFGTAHFRYNDYDLEFVGARKESYSRKSRKPDVEPGSFEDDISRRDFTINTLAVSLNKENF